MSEPQEQQSPSSAPPPPPPPPQQQQQSPQPPATAPDPGPLIEVTLKTLDDREIRCSIGLNQTIQALIDQARERLNITTGYQRIIAGGRVLNSSQTIRGAGLINGQTVHLVDRGPSGANDRPNVTPDRVPRMPHPGPVPMPPPGMLFPRLFPGAPILDPLQVQPAVASYSLVHHIRVPGSIAGTPVLSSRVADECVQQKALSLRMRDNPRAVPPNILNPASPFFHDPHYISWTVRIMDELMFRPRENIEKLIKDTINGFTFLPDYVKAGIKMKWEQNMTLLTVHIPEISPHIPSPALEKLDFLCLWTDHLTRFLDKVEENDGLLAATRHVFEMVKRQQRQDDLTQQARDERINALDAIVRHLEIQWAELSHMKDYERARFEQNNTPEYHALKIQEYPASSRSPRFFMRHALDTDLHTVLRDFRKQRRRFAALEDLLDDLNEMGALKFIRDSMNATIDYRYRALSMYFCYVLRMSHQISHITHIVSELDVPFMTPSIPQRLLPHYAINVLTVPYPHAATLVFKFRNVRADDPPLQSPITHVIEPPRLLADVVNRVNGDWPYLPYHPPSVHMEAVLQPPRRVAEPRMVQFRAAAPPPTNPPAGAQQFVLTQDMQQGNNSLNILAATDPISGMSLQDVLQVQQDQLEMFIQQHPALEGGRVRVSARPTRRFVSTTGDAPSIPVETQPPPVGDPQQQQQPGPSTTQRRTTTHRFNVQPDARGAETATLSAFPVAIEQSELQRISRNVASRYRNEALQRIATNLTTRFNDESWDTRIQNMPLCTLRECVAIALELLTSAGNSVNESKELMLALVRDEEVLVRAIAECVKSLFGRGEFPTHVARLIMPRNETASARNDYESVDGVEDAQSDEYDSMMVRVPSDISQPQSGDLRAIRERRQSRRQFLENRGRIQSTSTPSTSSAPANPPGPSFNSEDAADIRAGRLPTGNNRPRRTVRETVHPAPAASRADSPSQISLTFTATTHAFVPLAAMAAAGPSTSAGPSTGWPEQLQNFPIRQVVSPTPTTRGLLDFDMSEGGSDHLAARSTPSPPAPTPRTTSAPATVTSSPTRQEPMEVDPQESPEAIAARNGARVARAQIDHLAATFNGNLADSRRQHPFVMPPDSVPIDEERRRAVRALQYIKPMVAIDPFMHCTNRHCEINRLQNPGVNNPEMDRYTITSLLPDPEFLHHIQGMGPPLERRPAQVPYDDEDYNYTIKKNMCGDLAFHNLDNFKKFLRTTVRSLMAQCIDSDTLLTMNLNPISGYPAANHTELVKMVREHVTKGPGNRTSRYNRMSTVAGPWNQTPEHLQQIIDNMERNANRDVVAAQQQALTRALMERVEAAQVARPVVSAAHQHFPQFPPNVNIEEDVLIPGQIASLLTFLVDYMERSANPRPPGIFGLALELTYGRLTRHDFAQLARRTTATNVVTEFESQIRAHIRDNYLGGRTGLNNSELHGIAESLANSEEFFTTFMNQNEHFPRSFQFSMARENRVETVWVLRQIEIALIKALLTLSQANLDSATAVDLIMRSIDDYLFRNLVVFYRLADRVPENLKNQLRRISDYFATIRYEGNEQGHGINHFIEGWNRVMEYWFDRYNTFSECNFNAFVLRIRHGTDWNDVITQAHPSMPSSEPSAASSSQPGPSTSSSSSVPSTSNSVANNNPSPMRLIRTQIRRFFQENAITTAVMNVMMMMLTWWRR